MKVLRVLKKVDCGWYYDETYYDVLIDDEDYERLKKYRWTITKNRNTFYAQTKLNGKYCFMHHIINGVPIRPYVTDHVDRNGLNNQRSNLMVVTVRHNAINTRGFKSSKYPGVCMETSRSGKKYKASAQINGINKHLGRYYTEEEAHLAYVRALNEAGVN